MFANAAGLLYSNGNVSISSMNVGWQSVEIPQTAQNVINITSFPGYANAPTYLSSNLTIMGAGSSNTIFANDSSNLIVTFIDTTNNLIYLDRTLCQTSNSFLSVVRSPFVTSTVLVFKQLGLTAN